MGSSSPAPPMRRDSNEERRSSPTCMPSSADSTGSAVTAPPAAARGALFRYFLRLGATGFGGPVALVAAMHRDLVERFGWVSEAEYREGVSLAQISPGPLAAQLCFY